MTTTADTYRALIRRNYAISQEIAKSRDLDERIALRTEQRENSTAARWLNVSLADKLAIEDEEFARAYPRARAGRSRNPWSLRTSGRAS